jgi:hypothetical protein
MRHALAIAVRIALVATLAGLIRAILADRAPQRGLHGTEPVIGSIDTWPDVPRRPAD